MKVYPYNEMCNIKIKKTFPYINGKLFKIYYKGIKQGLEKWTHYHLYKKDMKKDKL